MANDVPYIMSFTSGGLSLRESLIVTDVFLSGNDWAQARKLIIQDNLLQVRMINSAKRILSEIIPRLQLFSEQELHFFQHFHGSGSASFAMAHNL